MSFPLYSRLAVCLPFFLKVFHLMNIALDGTWSG